MQYGTEPARLTFITKKDGRREGNGRALPSTGRQRIHSDLIADVKLGQGPYKLIKANASHFQGKQPVQKRMVSGSG